jgi:hypothetical protein
MARPRFSSLRFRPARGAMGVFPSSKRIRGTLHFPSITMIAPETFSHIENIKKRAGHLWRFL